MSVMRKLIAEREAKAAPATAIPFDDAATDAAIDNARAELQRAQDELSTIDSQWAEILMRRSLGESVDARAVIEVEERRHTVTQDVTRARALVQRLEQRTNEADRERRAAMHTDHVARLKELSAQAPDLERAYMAAATALVEAAQALNAARAEHANAWSYAGPHAHMTGAEQPPARAPYMPFLIPENFLRSTHSYVSWPQWLREYCESRHFGED